MILDAILLTLAEISSTKQRGITIIPEVKIAHRDEVKISHPNSGYELWLSGTVDYAVVDYDDVDDYKSEPHYPQCRSMNCFMIFSARLLGPGGAREEVAFDIPKGCIFLAEAKRRGLESALISSIPEAVSQAIAILSSQKYVDTARFIFSSKHCLPGFQRSVSAYLMGRHGFSLS